MSRSLGRHNALIIARLSFYRKMIGHCRNKHNEYNLGLPPTIHYRIRLEVYFRYYALRLAYQSHTQKFADGIFIT
jgi:hypothetical protein